MGKSEMKLKLFEEFSKDPNRGNELGSELGISSSTPKEVNKQAYDLGVYYYAYFEVGGDRYESFENEALALKEKYATKLSDEAKKSFADFLMFFMRKCDRITRESKSDVKIYLDMIDESIVFDELIKKRGY